MRQRYGGVGLSVFVLTLVVMGMAYGQDSGKQATSYAPVDLKETFASIMARMTGAKPEIMQRQMDLLNQRYDLSDRPEGQVVAR